MKKISKFITIILTVAVLCACLTVCLSASTAKYGGNCGANVKWTLTDDGVLTIGGAGAMKNYLSSNYVPWYTHRTSIKSVIIEDGVTSISKNAFFECSSLTSVTIPNSVTYIGDWAFYGCSSLASINIPDGVTSIGDSVFYRCSNLTNITIGEGVTSIGDSAFYGCSSLTNVYITDLTAWCNISFSSSDSYPLYYPGNLYLNGELVTDLVIPEGVTSIGIYAFRGCKNLTSIIIPSSVTSIGNSAFWGCKNLTSILIPDSVTSIGGSAFDGCSSLTSIIIPDSVTSIGGSAFDGCSSLTSIIIPGSVTGIGDYAFYNCSSLTSITIPDSVTSIGYYAFYGCSSLTNVYITDLAVWCNISFITSHSNPLCYEGKLYQNGELVTDLVISKGVTNIGNYAFYNYSNLRSITVPDSVTSIGNYAFRNCSSLASITFKSANTTIYDSGYTISSTATIYGYDDSTAQAYAEKYDRTFVTLCDGNHAYGDWLRLDNDNHIRYCERFNIDTMALCTANEVLSHQWDDGTVTTEPTCAIAGVKTFACTDCDATYTEPVSPTSEHIYGDWQKLDNESHIRYCTGLNCEAFESAEHIWNDGEVTAEPMCGVLGTKTFTCTVCEVTRTEDIPAKNEHSYGGWQEYDNDNHIRYCTCGDFETVNHEYTNKFDDLCDVCNYTRTIENSVASGKLSDSLYWSLSNDGVLTISGTGAMRDYPYYAFDDVNHTVEIVYAPWHKDHCDSIKYVIIEEGVTNVGSSAFYQCRNLTSVCIPASVTDIRSAFDGCESLVDISVSEDSQHYMDIDGVLFTYDRTELIYYPIGKTDTSYEIPESVASIRVSALGCPYLTSITVNDNNPNYADIDGVLFNKSGTEVIRYPVGRTDQSYVIPNGVISVGSGAFSGCHNLTNVVIPDGVTSLGGSAFASCPNITSIDIPDSVTDIGSFAFAYCTNLSSVNLSDGISVIAPYTFDGCSNLTTITIPESVETIESCAFGGCSNLASATIMNPTVTFKSDYIFPDTVTICGHANSTAQIYAENRGMTFELLHNWNDGVIIKEPTCLTTGVKRYTCIDCGKSYTEDVPVSDIHSYGEWEKLDDENHIRYCTTSYNKLRAAYSTVEFSIPVIPRYGYPAFGQTIQLSLPSSYTENGYTSYASYVVVVDGSAYYLGLNDDGAYEIKFGYLSHGYNYQDKNTTVDLYSFGDNATLTVVGTFSIAKDSNRNEVIRVSASDFKYYVHPSENNWVDSKFTTTFWPLTQRYDVKATYYNSNGSHLDTSYFSDWTIVDGTDILETPVVWGDGSSSTNTIVECTAFETATHSWNSGDVTTDPTCATPGTKTFTCTDCSATSTEPVPATGNHAYSDWQKLDDDKHIRSCTGSDCDSFDTAPHNWDNGIEDRTEMLFNCIDCDAEQREPLVTKGDINGDETVDKNDAIYLLYSVLFGEAQYPLNQTCDFNGDGTTDKNDAIYLLYHALFGAASYPLS